MKSSCPATSQQKVWAPAETAQPTSESMACLERAGRVKMLPPPASGCPLSAYISASRSAGRLTSCGHSPLHYAPLFPFRLPFFAVLLLPGSGLPQSALHAAAPSRASRSQLFPAVSLLRQDVRFPLL